MAVVCVVVSAPNLSIDQLNGEMFQLNGTVALNSDAPELLNAVIDLMSGAAVGNLTAGTVQVTVRSTDPGVTTSGTHSNQISVNVG